MMGRREYYPHMRQEADTSCRTHEYQLLNSDDLWYNLVVYMHIKKMGALAKMLSDCIPLCADTWCTLCDIHAKVLQSFLVLVNLRRINVGVAMSLPIKAHDSLDVVVDLRDAGDKSLCRM